MLFKVQKHLDIPTLYVETITTDNGYFIKARKSDKPISDPRIINKWRKGQTNKYHTKNMDRFFLGAQGCQ